MKWHDLVFIDEPRMRWRRHVLFWVVWLVYFTGTFFYKEQPFIKDGWLLWTTTLFIKSIFILCGHAFICYITIYFLLPQFLLKGRYFSFTGLLVISGIIVTVWTYLCYAWLFPVIDSNFHSSTAVAANVLLWNSILGGFLSSLKLVAIAATIKLLKRWWLKQNENMRLEKEKINVELQLLKAQIHPDFLFSSLDNIYLFAQNNDSPRASLLLLKLSDLLSYMLYECDKPLVPLNKEIQMVKDYMMLEKTRIGKRLEMDLSVKGNADDKMIAPLLLLPFIENSFSYCDNEQLEKTWINLDLRIGEDELTMKLVNGKPVDKTVPGLPEENGLANVHKRLNLLYPGSNELKIQAGPELMITFLKIKPLSSKQEFEELKSEMINEK